MRLTSLITITLIALVATPAVHAQEVFCGVGAAPGSPGFQAYLDRLEAQEREIGYLFLCDESMARYDFVAQAKAMAVMPNSVKFVPTALEKTRFAGLELVGTIPEYQSDRTTTAIRRVFRSPAGEVITLFEWDMVASGGSMTSHSQRGLTTVRGQPGRHTVVQSPSGLGHSELGWTENGRRIEVTINQGYGKGATLATLQAIADSLPQTP